MSETLPIPRRHSGVQSRLARRFFIAALGCLAVAAIIFWLLSKLFGKAQGLASPGFAISTLLLWCGSLQVHRALHWVSLERQREFRRSLTIALTLGLVFTGVQSYVLWSILPTTEEQRTNGAAELGSTAFFLMFGCLHALHFVIAILFLLFVTLRAYEDRYDHEYHWGVTLCTWFWHALGIVWMAILVVLFFASRVA